MLVWMLGKNTILKAIHNLGYNFFINNEVWMLGKNTILKAIHNNTLLIQLSILGVNAG